MRKLVLYITVSLLLVTACKHPSKKIVEMVPTGNPETPYILTGDYTPDTGVIYKVLIGNDTCFVIIDSIDNDSLYGIYYPVVTGSDCVERTPFSYDRHWRDKRREATVYIYQDPAFTPINDSTYRYPRYKVNVKSNIEYGQALGYWTSLPETEGMKYGEIISNGLKRSIMRTTQSLTMDVYSPACYDSDDYRAPLIMLMHGGGFYIGDKSDRAISGWCQHFASMGYVAVSINYRMGFMPTRGAISRTGYMALQDAHAAMRYLVKNAERFDIDTSNIFVGGASAGSITALNLAFMRNKDRPKTTAGGKRDLGEIESSGNNSQANFHIKAVANMWGAVTDLNILANSHTDIVSFHGDADQIVPYDSGYPFTEINNMIGKGMFFKMYGSVQIDKRAQELGYRSVFYPFKGEGHSLQHNADGSWNQKNFAFIRDKMTEFFYREIAGKIPVIEEDRNDPRHFVISDDQASETTWQVIGGYIMKISDNDIWVVWRSDATERILKASGLNARNFGFNTKKIVNSD